MLRNLILLLTGIAIAGMLGIGIDRTIEGPTLAERISEGLRKYKEKMTCQCKEND
jgi:hypothetical protein